MQIHGLFPTLLLQAEHNEKDRIKDVVLKTIMKHVDADGYSDESTGHVTIHHDPMYEPIFVMASELAVKYCEVMKIDPDLFNFNIVKSWFNITKDRATPFHSHADAHLSFVYYVNVPEICNHPIRFYAHPDKYDPFPGFSKFNNPEEWNPFNSYAWMFPALEGTMYIWPAKMCHDTIGKTNDRDLGIKSIDDAKLQRIAIAGDIILTYNEKAAKPLGLQPKRNWRTFKLNPNP